MSNSTNSDRQLSFDESEPDVTSPTFHLDVLDGLVHSAECEGAVPLASDPDNRYPYAYPRDIASITRAWLRALEAGVRPEECRDRIVDAARFFVSVQDDDGRWRQRYELDGTDKGIYHQEDNVAHGIRVLAHSVFALDASGDESADSSFYRSITDAFERAVDHVRRRLFDPNANLVESTTSIHEGRIESGYTLWVNCANIAALRQAQRALELMPVEAESVATDIGEFRELLEGGVERGFASYRQLPRRYSPTGDLDFRPDVTLLAPAYFELDDLFGDALHEAAERAAGSLEDPRLGGLQRFLGFYDDYEVQQHGGNGPWMQYTAWHAQYRFQQGEQDRGKAILEKILSYADEEGHIPEHLTTRDRFESFMEREWHTRQDFEKEFDPEVLRDIPFDQVVTELQHMSDSYQDLAEQTQDRDVVSFASPLAWSHAEFLTALLDARENGH